MPSSVSDHRPHTAMLVPPSAWSNEIRAHLVQRLAGCPAEWREPALHFMRTAPHEIVLYLACVSSVLVAIARERRTGCAEWKVEGESGSPEVLRSLMFKWGPRFQRHRWTW